MYIFICSPKPRWPEEMSQLAKNKTFKKDQGMLGFTVLVVVFIYNTCCLPEIFLTFILVHVPPNSCTCISNDNDIVAVC